MNWLQDASGGAACSCRSYFRNNKAVLFALFCFTICPSNPNKTQKSCLQQPAPMSTIARACYSLGISHNLCFQTDCGKSCMRKACYDPRS